MIQISRSLLPLSNEYFYGATDSLGDGLLDGQTIQITRSLLPLSNEYFYGATDSLDDGRLDGLLPGFTLTMLIEISFITGNKSLQMRLRCQNSAFEMLLMHL